MFGTCNQKKPLGLLCHGYCIHKRYTSSTCLITHGPMVSWPTSASPSLIVNAKIRSEIALVVGLCIGYAIGLMAFIFAYPSVLYAGRKFSSVGSVVVITNVSGASHHVSVAPKLKVPKFICVNPEMCVMVLCSEGAFSRWGGYCNANWKPISPGCIDWVSEILGVSDEP